jgi:hypothetical protein
MSQTAKRRLAKMLSAALAVSAAGLPGVAESALGAGHVTAYWQSCPPKNWNAGRDPRNQNLGPRNDRNLPIAEVRAHAMSCVAVRRAIARGTIRIHCCGEPPPGPLSARFRTAGFHCTGPDPIRCTGRRRRFVFEWAE